MDTWNVDFASLHRKAAPLQKLVAPVIQSGSTNALYVDMAMPSGHGDMGSMGQLREQQKKGFANGIRAIRDSGGITMVYIGAIDD